MFSTVTGNDWFMFDMGPVRDPPKSSQMVSGCLVFLVDLHSLVQYWPLLYLLHIPEGWDCLFLPFPDETLFLGIPCLQFLLRYPSLPQLKHLAFWCLLIHLEIAYPTSVLWSNVSMFIVCRIHSSIGADITFKGPNIFLLCKLAFSEARDLISTHLTGSTG